MPDNYYIPGLPENLQGILYTPAHGAAETKRLREKFAGNQGMQQTLMADDRYHQGKGMIRDSPLAALAALVGSVPYDAAKLAYFHAPKPVQRLMERGTEAMFPGEGFNQKTTSRPTTAGTGAYMHGMAEGAYGALRDKIKDVNGLSLPDGVVDRLRSFTTRMNEKPTLATALMPSPEEVERQLRRKDPKWPSPGEVRGGMGKLALQTAVAHAADPVGTSLKVLSNIIQTAVPDTDTRQEFKPWMEDRGMGAIAPGLGPIKPMSPTRKAAQNAQISSLLESWPAAKPVEFPINMQVRVPK